MSGVAFWFSGTWGQRKAQAGFPASPSGGCRARVCAGAEAEAGGPPERLGCGWASGPRRARSTGFGVTVASPTGHRELRPPGQADGADAAGLWDRAR